MTSSPGRGNGSSPLARGLLRDDGILPDRHRIIPARAGFTSSVLFEPPRTRDHPRSRGVYFSRALMSSSLWRIIPARAGFTPSTRGGGFSPQDHPRSRGVYPTPPEISLIASGSSPLARGLLQGRDRLGDARRIIPARAGFTSSPGISWRTDRDHPRSRGVYDESQTVEQDCYGSSPLARGLHAHHHIHVLGIGIIPARAGFTCR